MRMPWRAVLTVLVASTTFTRATWAEAEKAKVSADEAVDEGRAAAKAGNLDEAKKWYGIAADQGSKEGQFLLGNQLFASLLASSMGVKIACAEQSKKLRDIETLLQKAGEQGHVRAASLLGRVLSRKFGDCEPARHKLAVVWLTKAAEQGDALAQFRLGQMLKNGEGVEKDVKQARLWLQKAADQGNKWAKRALQSLE